ncbi:hypothetical protein M409DRAFT_60271 [Zasmidium cellare ATCC 36951]|uniref:Uncharacterized protein n=1 Tax=Zasmidium cellare ATCC 36951 TaxID=1080233 RepID=A0A6A6C1M3_ZASCE|nr:uncharacterized protein M409DRAFT_60271 [Zasmidium cellare ATCC 36951]KAF2160168.1 hypothetical protein M409DRAFT_60271 [Zasmidium cellare ATCC 36951]
MNQVQPGAPTGPSGRRPSQIRCDRAPQGCPNFLEPDDRYICKPCRGDPAGASTLSLAVHVATVNALLQQNERNHQAQLAAARNARTPPRRMEGGRDRSRSPDRQRRRPDRERPPLPTHTPGIQRRAGQAAIERRNPAVMDERPCPWCLGHYHLAGNADSHRLRDCSFYNAANHDDRERFVLGTAHRLQSQGRVREERTEGMRARLTRAGEQRIAENRAGEMRAGKRELGRDLFDKRKLEQRRMQKLWL